MSFQESPFLDEIRFRLTPEHDCSYLDDQQAITLFVDPEYPLQMQQYNELAKIGFRRSGNHVYRPHCSHCGLCIPVRIPVADFKPNRSQRRNIKLNSDITVRLEEPVFKNEHYELYRRYMQNRHAGGGMDNDEPESYEGLIKSDWCNTTLLEFRLKNKLIMVAIIDRFGDGISAVYTFFDPDYPELGLGVYGILSEIEFVKAEQLDWLYLGYWNPKTAKMSYKINYKPMMFFDGQDWQYFKKEGSK